MKVGDIQILDNREDYGHLDSWTVYLCLEKLTVGFELTIKAYEIIGETNDYIDEDGEIILPDEIDGQKVSHSEGDSVVGTNLMISSYDDGSVNFTDPNDKKVDDWLKLVSWNDDEIIQKIKEIISYSN